MRNKREKGDRPRKGKNQVEREEPSQTRSRMEDHSKSTGSHRALRQSSGRGRSLTRRRRVRAQNNLLTGGRAEKVDLEADQRPGEHKGENQEPPKTRSSSEDHPVRGRQRLQGASLATNLGTKRKLAEEGQGAQDNPRPQQGPRRQPLTPTRDREEHWRELRTTEAHGHMEGHPATHPEGQGTQRRRRQRLEVQPGTDQWTRLKRGHYTFVTIEDKQTLTPQG